MGNVVTLATGTRVSPDFGAPSIEDMSINLPRICRFAGNGWDWFPVGLHTFVVCDLLPAPLKVYGMLHDGPEGVGNDVPSPVKSPATEVMEANIFNRMLEMHKLPVLDAEQTKRLKIADTMALWAEVWTYGPPQLREVYPNRLPTVEALTTEYARRYPPLECIRRGGSFGKEFMRRWEIYRALAPTR